MAPETKFETLVSGGSGFLGKAIIESLLEKYLDWNISILDIIPPPPSLTKRISQFIQADLTSAESVNNAFVDYSPHLVIHTAGIVPARASRYSSKQEDWEQVKAVNYDGTRYLLDAIMAAGCRHFVYTSSCTVVIDDQDHDYYYMDESVPIGNATLNYGRSKSMAEAYVLDPRHAEKGLEACALRPCTIIGPGDTAVISLIHDLIVKDETKYIIGDGYNLSDWMYIDNAVQAHMLAVENLLTSRSAAGEAFFISNCEPVYLFDFFLYVWAQFGHVPRSRYRIPSQLAWAAGYISELVTWCTGGASTLSRGSVKDGIRTQFANNDKARRILGYKPKVGLAEGVRLTCEGYKKHLAAEADKKQHSQKA